MKQMIHRTRPLLLVCALLVVLCSACASGGGSETGTEAAAEPHSAATAETEQDTLEVIALVQAFGRQLQQVSLLAEAAAEEIKTQYETYLTPELLQQWMAAPEQALGRSVSSPWPDHIVVLSVRPEGAQEYTVEGKIIYITSVEMAQGGAAEEQPITLKVVKSNGEGWRISSITTGEPTPGQEEPAA